MNLEQRHLTVYHTNDDGGSAAHMEIIQHTSYVDPVIREQRIELHLRLRRGYAPADSDLEGVIRTELSLPAGATLTFHPLAGDRAVEIRIPLEALMKPRSVVMPKRDPLACCTPNERLNEMAQADEDRRTMPPSRKKDPNA